MDLSQRATVAVTTSFDERNPPSAMLDGFDRSFWSTGGMYPQEFIVALEQPATIDKVVLVSAGIRGLTLEGRDATQNNDFVRITHQGFENGSTQQSTELNTSGVRATHLRFMIDSGFGDFCAVYRVQIVGQP
eukprot:TRINITY_DN1611_c0_g1_i18.p1 TRINITY_DN1611_c0_g1~~TRINITY_DN1611_c0_g1_i18.p1  ORF type:complete len:132 (-),score=23.39 TRINITY_DN1611_c0_g1_i18:448-843(-)